MNKEICWNITARCNQVCKYCHRFLNIKDLKYEDNLKILNNLISSGVTSITWTGGEALLLDDVDELMKISCENGVKNKLITNGKLLTTERIDKIYKYLDSITLSIDSVDSEINDLLGRGRFHFEEVKTILDYILEKKYKIKIRINSVVCKTNLDSFDKLCDFLNQYNIFSWRIFKFMPLREMAVINKSCFEVQVNEFKKAVEYVKKHSNIENIDTRIEDDMEKKYILILADGSIVVTENGSDKKIGNALVDSIKEI